MSVTLSNITGGAQTGFTTPGYTVTADVAPDTNGKQVAVTAITGTQTGVRAHSVSDPFTITYTRPKVPKTLPSPNPITGKYGNVPENEYTVVIRKGVNIAANVAPMIAIKRVSTRIPAGADAYDAPNVRALESAFVGVSNQQSAGVGDMLVSGII